MIETQIIIKLSLLFVFLFLFTYYAKKIGIPAVLSFMLCGIFAKFLIDEEEAESLKLFEISGLILLLFFLGIEFSFERLKKMVSIVPAGIIGFVFNFIIPFFLLLTLGFDLKKSLFISAIIYPTSTAIIVKLLTDYNRVILPEVEFLIGILIFEDLISIILISLMSEIAEIEKGLIATLTNLGKILGVFAIFYIINQKVIPRVSGWLDRISEDEIFVFFVLGAVLFLGFSFRSVGISEALGAFLLGVLVPETKVKDRIIYHLSPFKELSIGIFFFFFAYRSEISFEKDDVLTFALILSMAVILKIISAYIGGYIYGLKRKTNLRASLSFTPRGEFSAVIASFEPSIRSITFSLIMATSILGSLLFIIAPKIADRIYPAKKIREDKEESGKEKKG